MAIVAHWRTGNTNPPVLIPLWLGRDALTGEARTIVEGDVISMIMRNETHSGTPAQLIGPLEVVELSEPRANDAGEETSQAVIFKPEDGDFDLDGTYDVVFDRTDENGDVETIPDRAAVTYQFLIGAKPNDA
jgi:hypothetical protein